MGQSTWGYNRVRCTTPAVTMQNDQGQVVDLYVPRKCSATNRLIIAKDHASVKITGSNVTYAFCGSVRETGDADDSLNRLATGDGLLKNIWQYWTARTSCRVFVTARLDLRDLS